MTGPTTAASAPHKFTILAGLGALLAVLELGRLVIFAAYPVPPAAWSVAPWSPFMTRHACTTAYWSAATTIGRTPDVYSPAAHSAPDPATGSLLPRRIGAFPVDPYEYPPTFLLVPRALAAVAPEFVTFRHVWLLLNAALVIAGMVAIARRVDAATGSRSLWLLPLALVPLTTMIALQMGNAQLVFMVLAAVALLAFERGRPALGGLLLAYAIVGKLFPGLLLVYLAIRREWRAVGWTTGWALILTLVTIADIGWAPFSSFLDHLPRLLSGEAFPMLRGPVAPPNSQSIPGLVLKLPSLGGPDVPFVSLQIAGWIYSAVILWATVRLALRPLAPRLAPLAWLVVLGLAAFRSPVHPELRRLPGRVDRRDPAGRVLERRAPMVVDLRALGAPGADHDWARTASARRDLRVHHAPDRRRARADGDRRACRPRGPRRSHVPGGGEGPGYGRDRRMSAR